MAAERQAGGNTYGGDYNPEDGAEGTAVRACVRAIASASPYAVRYGRCIPKA